MPKLCGGTALSERFITQLAQRLGREKKALEPAALARLVRHAWPGNVRELRNVIERAFVMAPGAAITEADLDLEVARRPDRRSAPTPGITFAEAKKQAVQRFERAYLSAALREHDGNVSRTAEAIGMVRQSLQQKIRELCLRSTEETES